MGEYVSKSIIFSVPESFISRTIQTIKSAFVFDRPSYQSEVFAEKIVNHIEHEENVKEKL